MRHLVRPLYYAGAVAIVFALAKIHAAWIAEPPYDFTGSSRLGWTISYAVLLSLAGYATGLPDLPRTLRQAVAAAVLAPLVTAAGVSFVQLATGDALLPRFVVFGSVLLIIPWALLCVTVARGGELRAQHRDRVVVVTEPAEAIALRDELDDRPERPAVLLNHLTVPEARPANAKSKPVVELVTDIGANVVVLDREAMGDEQIVGQVATLHEHGVRVRTLTAFYEGWIGKVPVSELERASLLFDVREIHGGRYLRVKRLLDLAAGALGSVALLLLAPVVLLGNLTSNRGPLLYRQERIGKRGRVFTILKFRTMRPRADGDPLDEWTAVSDPRITPFGGLLRRAHIDELPQVINILRGDLSVVGPRPEQPKYVEELLDKLPFYDFRHVVRPGLTGWAQVNYGYSGDERGALEKLQYDFWYLQHQSLRLDLRIIGRTFRSVAGSRGGGR